MKIIKSTPQLLTAVKVANHFSTYLCQVLKVMNWHLSLDRHQHFHPELTFLLSFQGVLQSLNCYFLHSEWQYIYNRIISLKIQNTQSQVTNSIEKLSQICIRHHKLCNLFKAYQPIRFDNVFVWWLTAHWHRKANSAKAEVVESIEIINCRQAEWMSV